MKKILTPIALFVLILFKSISFAQTTHPVELGFNIGASWLQSDVKMKKLGGAGGFTLGQMYLQNDKNMLDWGWRFRYLNALAYGQDSKKSNGIANNTAFNGTADTSLNYYSNGGFVYQNYKTTLNELSLELVIGANRMRNKTKFYPYIFGGLGITKAVVKTDQLNANNFRYNYGKVDSLGTASSSQITSSLNDMYDGSYETAAEGSKSPSWKFMPSVGVGLGYQLTPAFSFGLEHKMTWALNDVLDGQKWANDNTLSPSKDKYHYSSIWIKFSFGRGTHTSSTTTTNSNIDTNTNTTTITPTTNKPVVNITNPSASPFTSTSQSYTVKAIIKNVASKSDIGLVYNGVSNTNFTYDVASNTFAFPLMLISGNNTFMITATNADGSATGNATVIYGNQVIITPPAAPAPIVTISSPSINPFSTTTNAVTVLASVLNVTSQSQINVKVDGVATSSFSYSTSSHILNMNVNLNPGTNTVVISATNASGSDSKSININYNISNPTPPPVVIIVNPAVNPFTSGVSVLPINATINNVTSVGQISVTNNGVAVPISMLSFNSSTGQLSFNANLIVGANSITITATNSAGNDSKAITIIYNQPIAVVPAPIVTITSPSVNPFNATTNVATVNATVLNVTSSTQISVSVNGANTTAFSYNVSTKQFALTTNLIVGANVVSVSATNTSGSDSKSQTVIYAQQVATPAPVVTISLPTVNPFNTSINTALVNATVLNVTSSSQITVSVNGIVTTSYTYNTVTKQLSLNASLIVGVNVISISASNVSGSDSKSQTIIYSQPTAKPAPIVAITNPTANPYTVATNITLVNATVLNVTSSSQITVTINGVTAPFSYNPVTTQLMMNANLIAGANIVTISANNLSGSDSKSTTIIYSAPVVVSPAPIVTISSPSVNPYTTSVNYTPVNATVLNVTSSSQINATLNGATVPFTYNAATKQLALTASLVVGANMVTVMATTASGSDSKTTTIIYSSPVVSTPAPIVTITNPSVNPYTSTVNSAIVNATVLNVVSSSEITVNINGATVPFTYNAATKQVTLTASLIAGANVITVSATTASGSDSKSTTIIYTAPVVVPAPVVTITTPNVNPFNASINTAGVVASVLNVTTASAISVTVNGVSVPFTFNALSHKISFTANLIIGANMVTVSATTPSGSDSKSITIIYTAPVAIPAPVVTITNPAAAAASTTPVYNIEATVLNVSTASNISVTINGVNLTSFTYNSILKQVTFNAALTPGNNTIVVSATNASGSDSKTVTIKYTTITTNPLDPQETNNPLDPGTTGHTVGGVGHGVTTPTAIPTITYAFPNPYTTINAIEVVGASVGGVAGASNIVVNVNGVSVPFSYSAIKKTISFSANLNMGTNIISVIATNAVGVKTEDLTVIRN